jgi:hypothetical protein
VLQKYNTQKYLEKTVDTQDPIVHNTNMMDTQESKMQSKVAQLVERMFDYAAKTKDDRVSVLVSRTADRLAHQGSLFEKALDQREIAVINLFLKMEKNG